MPFIQETPKSMERSYTTCTVYTDFSKPFLYLNLITKLRNFGVHGNLFDKLVSYLNNRCQYVAINGSKYETLSVTSRVTQGSHLGPWLVNIFLNDISKCFKNTNVVLCR